MHKDRLMMYCGKKFFKYIVGLKLQAGGAYAWMAAEVFAFSYIFIDQKLYMVVVVIHKPHNADCAWLNI